MSSRHPFDEQFRKKLGKHEMPIPEGIWNNIEKELTDNRFRTILPWLIAFSLIIIAGGVFYYTTYDGAEAAKTTAMNILENKRSSAAEKLPEISTNSEKNSENQDNIYSETSNIKTSEIGTGSADLEKNENKKKLESSSNKTGAPVLKAKGDTNTKQVIEQKKTLIAAHLNENNAIQNEVLSDEIITEEYQEKKEREIGITMRSLDKISSRSTDMLTYDGLPLPKLRNLRDRNCDDQAFNPGKMFLEFSYGAYKGNMNFQASDEKFEDYRKLRDNGEVFKNGTNLQALLGFQIGKRLFFKTGISYTRVVSDYYFVDQINKRTTTDTIFDPNTGQIIDVITREEDIFINGQNSYTFVEIPLLLTYGWQFNKLGVGITTGPQINLSFSREGHLPNINGQGVDLDSGKWNDLGIYRRTAGLSWVAGLQFSYQTYRNVELFVAPRIVAGLNSITLQDDGLEEDVAKRAYPLSQKMFQYGVNVGLRYVINDK